MIDIFEERQQPKLYIADVVVKAIIPINKNSKKVNTFVYKLNRIPIILVDNKIPSRSQYDRLFKGIFNKYIKRGDFNNIKFTVVSIENIKFSSKLNYIFEYD
jgi:hypothetical protein